MTPMSDRRVFGIALAAGVALVLASAAYARRQRPAPVKANQLTEQIAISKQLQPDQVSELRHRPARRTGSHGPSPSCCWPAWAWAASRDSSSG